MHDPQMILHVRQLAHETFCRLGAAPDSDLHESILIRDGYYCGRRFISAPIQAIWFFEDNQVKFYDADGLISEVINVASVPHTYRSRVA